MGLTRKPAEKYEGKKHSFCQWTTKNETIVSVFERMQKLDPYMVTLVAEAPGKGSKLC